MPVVHRRDQEIYYFQCPDITDTDQWPTSAGPPVLLSVLMYRLHLHLQASRVPRSLLCHHQAAPIMHPDSQPIWPPVCRVLQQHFCTIRDLRRNSIKTRIWYSADLNYNPGFIYLWQWQRSWSILERILTPETLYFKFHCDFVLSPRAWLKENLPLFFISRSEG